MSTENRWIVVRRIYNPLQGDFWEDYNELDVVEGGSVEVFYGNGSCVLNQDAFFLGKSERSLYFRPKSNSKGASVLQVRFHKDLFPQPLLELWEMRYFKTMLNRVDDGIYGNSDKVVSLMSHMSDSHGEESDVGVLSMLYRVLDAVSHQMYELFPSKRVSDIVMNLPQDTVVRKLNDYMLSHIDQPAKLLDLARIAGLTDTSLCRFFKTKTGMSPIAYMNKLRLQTACELLEQTGDPVKEIVFRCGYSDTNFFFKLFKREIGMTPLKYRCQKQKLQSRRY